MVSHSNNYYLEKMPLDAKNAVLSIISKKPNYTKLKKDVAEYYRLRQIFDKQEKIK